MPWRKYPKKEGKHGLVYHIQKGVQVRRNIKGNWMLFVNNNGLRTNRTIGHDREALVKAIKAAEKIAETLAKNPVKKADGLKRKTHNFNEYSKDWLLNNSCRWHVNTHTRYEEVLRLHILPDPDIRNKALEELSRQDIKKFLLRLFKKRSSSSVEMAYSTIHGIFEEAIDENIVQANPAKGLLKKVLPPQRKRNVKEADPLTMEERDLFMESAEQKLTLSEALILKVMVYAGFRLGETLAMRFRHLDFNKMTYQVCETYKQHRFSKTKTGKKRLVDLPEFLLSELKSYILYLKKENLANGIKDEVDLLFEDPKEGGGWPFSQRKVQVFMKKACKGAGLRFRNPHDLRHTYATILLMAHQSPDYVQKQLGHSSISITVDTYGHWVSGEGRQGLEKALLGSVRNRNEKQHKTAYATKATQVST
jgi:integrase